LVVANASAAYFDTTRVRLDILTIRGQSSLSTRRADNDLFQADFHEATVVTLFLLPSINLKLRPKLLQELRLGTRVVSNTFDMGDWRPEKEQRSA
jgi:hypothetical protein